MEPIQKHESKNSGSVTSGGRIEGPLSRIQRDLEEVAVFFPSSPAVSGCQMGIWPGEGEQTAPIIRQSGTRHRNATELPHGEINSA